MKKKLEKLAFWLRYNNDKHFVCNNCSYSTKTVTEFCPSCQRRMINMSNIEEDKKK